MIVRRLFYRYLKNGITLYEKCLWRCHSAALVHLLFNKYYHSLAGPDTRQPPTSAGELTANFTREERLAMYEYALQNAAGVATPQEILPLETNPADNQPKELSGLELKKAMRDFKRRRQAYRTKVSTKNKSQTQVTRELIHNMMMYLGVEEQEHETVHAEGDSTDMSKPGCYQQSIEGKNLTPVPRHLYGKRDGRVYNKHYYAKDRKEYEGGDCWNGGQKREREYDSSYRSQMEKEYGPEGNKDKRKYNNKRKHDPEYHKTYYKDKRYKPESRWNKSEERSRGRKYDRYSESESYLKNSSEHSYLRLQDDVHVPVKEHSESSTKAVAKLQKNKDESVKLERNVASFKCTIEKIKEDSWDKGMEKRKGEKEENTTEGEISSHESQSSYSERDHKAGSSKHRKKQKLKRKKIKRKHKKKRKHRKDYKHRWHESESEESENDKDYKYRISKADVNKDYRYKMSKTDVHVKESSA